MIIPKSLARYWHTVRHLRKIQIYGRLWFKLARPKPDLNPAPSKRALTGEWVTPAARAASVTGPESFVFLGELGNLKENGWDDPAKSKLWRYNQHYFDDLNAKDAETRREWNINLIKRWMAENPPGMGTGWEPYPVSLRIVNWVKFSLSGGMLEADAGYSLAIQARWLMKRLEWHLLGNHLFANAKSLLFAGMYFTGVEANAWRRRAISILKVELEEQFLSDGGHFELTPMYHALAIEDLLDIINLMTAFETDLDFDERQLFKKCADRLPKMLRWLDAMSHPDGGISFFNDAAFGVAPDNSVLYDYASRLGIDRSPVLRAGILNLCDSGFVRMSQDKAIVLCDIGRIGPDYLPGHAHADTLSFELSLAGERIIVNSGTSEYGLSDERLRQRGTAAHSTVVVDGADSSEVWSGFRVARRARVDKIKIIEKEDELVVRARHDGYTRFPNGPFHSRLWTLTDKRLVIYDRLAPSSLGEARFHLVPGISVEISRYDVQPTGVLGLPSGQRLEWRATADTARVEITTWHPRFGESQAACCLILRFFDEATFELRWA